MTHWKTQFNYPYLGAHSLPEGKDLILTIREMKREEVTGENGKKDMCLIAYFHENVKPMVVNKTNCKTLEKLFKTPDIEQWINKAMQVGSARVNVKGEMIDALRIRPFAPKLGRNLIVHGHMMSEVQKAICASGMPRSLNITADTMLSTTNGRPMAK